MSGRASASASAFASAFCRSTSASLLWTSSHRTTGVLDSMRSSMAVSRLTICCTVGAMVDPLQVIEAVAQLLELLRFQALPQDAQAVADSGALLRADRVISHRANGLSQGLDHLVQCAQG